MKIFVKLSFFVVVLLFVFISLPCHSDFIECENRNITPPQFSDRAFTDRLPFLTELIKLRRNVSFSLLQNEFSGAFFGREGYIFSADEVSADTLLKNLSAIETFVKESQVPVLLALIPQKIDVLYRYLPPLYADERQELWNAVPNNERYIKDILPMLVQKAAEGKYIYYKGDHHLTSLGSYYVYRALSSTLGIEPYGADGFSVSVVKSDFSGSDARKLVAKSDDKIAIFRYRGDNTFVTENLDTNKSYIGLYDFEKLHSRDPYGIFPIPDCGYARVYLSDIKRERLLLVADSYGDSLLPFLARHFDVDVIDPRYYYGSVLELIEENEYGKILFCFGMDTLGRGEVLYRLNV